MKTIAKRIGILACAVLLISTFLLTGCTTSADMSLTYNIENGDKVTIDLDITKKQTLKQAGDSAFTISKKDGWTIDGSFLLTDGSNWDVLFTDLASYDAEILDGALEKGYVYASIPSVGLYLYAAKVDGTNSGIKLQAEDADAIPEALECLTFTKG